MKVIDYKLFGSVGLLVAAAGLAVGSIFIAPDRALADKPSLKRNFRLSDGLKDLQQKQNVPTKVKSDANSQQPQWRQVEKSRLFPQTDRTIIPRLPYENPNGFKTFQFEQ